MNNRLCIGAQYASPGSGGIARVARLVARVAADEKLPATLLTAEPMRRDYLRVMRDAHTIFVSSRFTRDNADRLHGGFEHAKVCWPATLEDEPAEIVAVSGPPSVLIMANMAQDHKGHDLLIDAWPDVMRKIPDARLVTARGGFRAGEIEAVACTGRPSG